MNHVTDSFAYEAIAFILFLFPLFDMHHYDHQRTFQSGTRHYPFIK